MNRLNFIIFFSIFFLLYGLINFYVFLRGWQAIPTDSHLRVPYAAVFWILALSFIAGRFLERIALTPFSTAVVWVGSFWFAAFAYFTLAALLIDILRLINHIAPFFPSFVTENIARAKAVVALSVFSLVVLAIAVGYFNARSPRVKILQVHIPKQMDSVKTLDVAVASDIHLGTIIGRERLNSIVEKINNLHADLVLFPGDIVDEDLAPVIKQNLGETLRTIKAKYGVYAITGNHEYIGGVEEACKYLTDHGIRVLRDETINVNECIVLVGREDRSISQFSGNKRKPLAQLMTGVEKRYPIILMDHQPFGLHEAVEQGVDLQLSGHTHHGQLWPFNAITNAIYELSWGYRKTGQTHFYVSSGVGTWGPPVRIGNTPEIIHLKLTFGQQPPS
ncbi:MAG: metallophosphoesterase [Ignavibacteria bacterium]|nr:metallophosphoesterase [Ignavibacteria bacterium]